MPTLLHVYSGYAYGRSTLLAEEIPPLAAAAGYGAVLIADPHSLTGAVEFVRSCRKVGIAPLIGASIEIPEGGEIVLVARDRTGYRSLSRLISECHLDEPRLHPLATWNRLQRHRDGLLCLTGGDRGPIDRLLAGGRDDEAFALVERLRAIYPLWLQAERSYLPWTLRVDRRIAELSARTGLPVVAGGAITHARPEHFPAQDVLVCVETLCTLEEVVGRKPARAPGQPPASRLPDRALNAERYVRSVADWRRLYADRPGWIVEADRLAELCDTDVLPGRTVLPPQFGNDEEALREIVVENAFRVYGADYGVRHRQRLRMETERICRLGYATHFLVAWDLIRWAEERGVHTSGRGSVVDCAVAYVLGLSRIDAIAHRLHFDRFLPDDGTKRPDIDLDFEASRRDEARNHLVSRYGTERVATIAAIGAYCVRGIVREVGKVFSLPEAAIAFLAKRVHGSVSPNELESAIVRKPELRDSGIDPERYRWIFLLAERLQDVPRNIRLHSSGVIVASEPIRDVVPVQWAVEPSEATRGIRLAQWDKRSAKHFFDKFDILCLRGQDVLSGTERRLRTTRPECDVRRLGAVHDPGVYETMRSGDLIGIPQSASPAMRQAHVRLRTENLHDASLVQAGIRPGVGGAVKINELIARRRGKSYSFTHPDLEEILRMTHGIIVFQEQVDQLLQTFCGFSGGEAEEIRDMIHKRRREEFGETIRDRLVARCLDRGVPSATAHEVVDLIAGFKGYGFAQGHALAFAELSLRCVWLTREAPAEYFAALLSAQPAGYYGPATIANEARIRGVRVLRPDVLRSRRDFVTEAGAIRVGLMNVARLSDGLVSRIESWASHPPEYPSTRTTGGVATRVRAKATTLDLVDFLTACRPNRDELESLILAGALDDVSQNRRAMLWAVPKMLGYDERGDQPTLPFARPIPAIDESIPDFRDDERAMLERSVLGLDVERHLMAFERERIEARGGVTTAEATALPSGTRAIVVGHAIRLRFPPTKSGRRVVFWDLEDETGLLNVTAFDDVYQRDGHAIVCAGAVTVVGVVQDRDGSPAFLARRVYPYQMRMGRDTTIPLPLKGNDFLVG